MIITWFLFILSSVAIAVIAGLTFYDIKHIRVRSMYERHPHAKKWRSRPKISVLVLAGKRPDQTELTIRSILKSRYQKYEIIVISGDSLKEVTSKRSIKIVRPISHDVRTSLQAAYCQYGSGDIIVTVQAGARLAPLALTQVAWFFNAWPSIDVAKLKTTVETGWSAAGMLQQYDMLLSSVFDKARDGLGVYRTTDQQTAYRRDAFLTSSPRRSYASMVPINVQAVQSILQVYTGHFRTTSPPANLRSWAYTLTGFVLKCSSQIMLGYLVYVSFWLHQPSPLLICIAAFLATLLIAVWIDETMSVKQKIYYSLMIPISLPMFAGLALLSSPIVLKTLTDMTKAKIPLRIGLFVRVKNS